MTNGNDPINATTSKEWLNQNDTEMVTGLFGGLTKREYFAAMAMQGILSGTGVSELPHDSLGFAANVGKQAAVFSDALITALNTKTETHGK